MRRLLLITAGLAALSLSAPLVALADQANHEHHRGRHHHHKRHAHRTKTHLRHLGPPTHGTGTGPGTGAGAGNPPVTPPAGGGSAGKVASYTGGVLTLTLNDGSTVSGKVTMRTRIECLGAFTTPATSSRHGDDGQGDGQGDREDHGNGPPASGAPCDTSALVPGAIVHEAELRLSPTGSEFESIELVS